MARSKTVKGTLAASDAMTKLREARMAVEEAQKKVHAVGKKALGEIFQAFFKDNPDVESIRWTQYTPYFNDGEPCEFGVHSPYFKLKECDEAIVNRIADDGDGYIEVGSDWAINKLLRGETEWDQRTRKEKLVREATDDEKKQGQLLQDAQRRVQEFWNDISDTDVFEAALGDHIQVTATADGLEAEECQHD